MPAPLPATNATLNLQPSLVSQLPEANFWCQQLGLNLSQQAPAQGMYLIYDAYGLGLAKAEQPSVQPVRVDFVQGSLAHRLSHGGGRGQAVAKACGLKAGVNPRVLDATLGLAGDAAVLASLGCQVLGLERQPWVEALVVDALQRLQAHVSSTTTHPALQLVNQNLRLLAGDATTSMASLATAANFAPQVVYLDPMFPASSKSALAKKEMQFFQDLVGQDTDADQLLNQALELASHRVVVKRPKLAPYLAEQKPTFSLTGKANRFDIYTRRGFSAGACN